jgi:hypothetical protein
LNLFLWTYGLASVFNMLCTALLDIISSGRLGVGKRKRAVSPTVAGKLAKVVQQADEEARGSFRERARQEYEERRAEGRLVAATRTCVTLDEKAEKEVGVYALVHVSSELVMSSSTSYGLTLKIQRLSLLIYLKPSHQI